MALSHKQLAGPGYIVLNVIRVMNIISLVALIAGSIVMLVKTFVISKFFFFDAVSNVITSFVGMFLIVSELSIFQGWYARNWPVLAPEHGFVSLGIAMLVLGVNMLGNLNKESTSQKSLGLAMWRIVIASGVLACILGFFNIVASYVFRDRHQGITARAVRAHGAIATPSPSTAQKPLSIKTSLPLPVSMSPSVYSTHKGQSEYNAPRSPLHMRAFTPIRDTFRRARDSILPSYYSKTPVPYPEYSPARSKRESVGPRMPLNISAPMNVNPQYAHLVKPDLAHHPSTKKDVDMGVAF